MPATVRSALLLKRNTPSLVKSPTKPPTDANSKVPSLPIRARPSFTSKLPENVLVPPKLNVFNPTLVKL